MQSRRSNTNLSNLTLAPLTRTSLDGDEQPFNDQSGASLARQSSYIAGKSAPTTPGILSRSPSRTRLGVSSSTKLAGSKSFTHLTPDSQSTDLTKSKSAYSITPGVPPPPRRRTKHKSSSRITLSIDHDEWLYRAGTAISSEARESKGQSWLVSRDSSTSLVAQDREGDNTTSRALDPSSVDLMSPYSARASRVQSRSTSAIRGSKPGSRTDLYFSTPADSRTGLSREATLEDYFGHVQAGSTLIGPDFVDAEEEDYDDDEDNEDFDAEAAERREEDEVARLTSEKGSGLGGIVDRLLGWTLFEVPEDGRESDEEEEDASAAAAEAKQPPQREQQTQAVQKSHITAHAQSKKDGESPEGQGSWSDAAWLLSVASKVIL